ncbi:MAG: chromosomal replication initiator protein DnaA, partial [Endomicrobiia bacterium]
WRLRLKISEEELDDLLKDIELETGRPFATLSDEFNWGVYLYNIDEKKREELIKILENKTKEKVNVVAENQVYLEEKISKEKELEIEEEDFWQLKLNPNYTFEEFVVGPNNRFTHAAAMAVAENPGKVYNPLFIYGGVGLGKTHLMQAIGHYVKNKNPEKKVLYVTSEKFISEVIDSIGRGKIQEFRDRYRQIDLLLVDDVQFLAESESTQEEFFHTFNILHQNGKQIVLTSDRPPKQLTTLEDRLRSRFEWGLIADIKSPSLETRVAILKKKGEHENITLDDNMLLYVASKLKSNIRELEGFLKRINAYAAVTGQQVDMNLVKTLMRDLLPESEIEEEQVKVEEIPTASVKKPVIPPEKPIIKTVPSKLTAQPVPIEPVEQVPSQKVSIEQDLLLTPVEVAFFYPEGKEKELIVVKERFKNIIKKHNLKFRLESVFDRSYNPDAKINYGMFTELCKTNKVEIAVVLGPSSDSFVSNDEFYSNLSTIMENENISLQYINWEELNKDYRYLNLALDITLTKHKI